MVTIDFKLGDIKLESSEARGTLKLFTFLMKIRY